MSDTGEVAFKAREGFLSENSIWPYKNKSWRKILEDIDSDLSSPWISFRHELSVFGSKVLTVATSVYGEALILIEEDVLKTDLGPRRIHNINKDYVFFGAPAAGDDGEIVFQADLNDPDFPRTSLGIGLIKVK